MTLNELRSELGFAQRDLENETVSRGQLTALENGKNNRVDIALVENIARSMGLSPGEVFEACLASRKEYLTSGKTVRRRYSAPERILAMRRGG